MSKCSECGFLAAKNINTRNLEEVEKEFRRSGNSPNEIISGKEIGYPRHKEYPICFVQKYDLIDLFEGISGQNSARFLAIINEERECELFTKWQQGFTPKEHREMMDRERMQKWQTEREEADRKWRSKEQWQLVIVAGIFTLLGAIIAWLLTRGGH
ncbi:MAG TPA: hypothetical protein VIH69_07265 [Dehalococcoidia bacterium]